MATIQLREELFREMNPMLDSEVMLRQMLAFVRSLFAKQKTNTIMQHSTYEIKDVTPDIEQWSGCVTYNEEEIAQDERLSYILNK